MMRLLSGCPPESCDSREAAELRDTKHQLSCSVHSGIPAEMNMFASSWRFVLHQMTTLSEVRRFFWTHFAAETLKFLFDLRTTQSQQTRCFSPQFLSSFSSGAFYTLTGVKNKLSDGNFSRLNLLTKHIDNNQDRRSEEPPPHLRGQRSDPEAAPPPSLWKGTNVEKQQSSISWALPELRRSAEVTSPYQGHRARDLWGVSFHQPGAV